MLQSDLLWTLDYIIVMLFMRLLIPDPLTFLRENIEKLHMEQEVKITLQLAKERRLPTGTKQLLLGCSCCPETVAMSCVLTWRLEVWQKMAKFGSHAIYIRNTSSGNFFF